MKVRTTAAAGATLAVLLLLLTGCPSAPPPRLPEGAPRLVLSLVIDQGRADYLVRFRPLLTGGLGRLLDESIVFTDARYDHAATSTAPGHATLATGRHPAGHGIVGNYWYDRELEEEVYSVRDENGERSPRRMLATTFGDWLKEASPSSKVFAASGKDRAAILTAGHRADAAFWYDRTSGEMTTSSHYGDWQRPWIDEFHASRHVDRLFGTIWEPLPEVVEHAEDYGVVALDTGWFPSGFPHALGGARMQPERGFYGAIYASPFVDEYLVSFAETLIEAEDLGGDEATDFLGLSFSAVDAVGHDYGPDSPELFDTLLRLDRTLGELLDFVDRGIGLEHVIVSLSADHGVDEIPEYRLFEGEEARRFGAEEISCVERAGEELRRELGDEDWFLAGFYLDWRLAEEKGVDRRDLEDAIRRLLEQCPGIARVWTRTELLSPPDGDPYARLYAHSFHPERSPDVEVQLEPHTLPSRSARTNHGSPYPYDTRVPWLLRLPDGRHAEIDERVFTVDVAPTLAALVGFAAADDVDGTDRGALLRQP